MRITDHAEMLDIKGEHGIVHLTLLWDEKNLVLVDTGFPGQFELILAAIERTGHKPENLTHIIITHQDVDHIGCLKEFKTKWPHIQALAHEEEAPYIDGRKTPVKLAILEANIDKLPEERKQYAKSLKKDFANHHNLQINIDKTITDGEKLDLCGGIEVIFTPGHTPGHICLFVKDGSLLISGDSMNIAEGKPVGPRLEICYDMEQAKKSCLKMADYPVESLVVYHSGLLTGQLQEQIRDMAEKL
jgi:glyoxylase-like metal-dependent hydrolase (beta-lactamase superfamily II)